MLTSSKLPTFLILSLLVTACLKGKEKSSVEDFVACSTCKVFVSTSAYTGALGGIAGADLKCNEDAKSGSNVFKALLGGRTDSVLQANTIYIRQAGSTIGTTDGSGHFTFPLGAAISSEMIWTGLTTTWADAETCATWTDGTSGDHGTIGDTGATNNTLLQFTLSAQCSAARNILCVQQ